MGDILPAITTIERLCADALVAAERGIEKRVAVRLDRVTCTRLDRLTTEMLPGAMSRFIWLRRIEPGKNSPAANRLLDRLEFLRAMNLDPGLLADVHRIASPGCDDRANVTSPMACAISVPTDVARSSRSASSSGLPRPRMR